MSNINNIYASPKAKIQPVYDEHYLYAIRRYILVEEKTTFPNRCYRCNDEAEFDMPMTLHLYPQGAVLMLFIGIFFIRYLPVSANTATILFILTIVVSFLWLLLGRKKLRIKPSLCTRHHLMNRIAFWGTWIAFLMMLVSGYFSMQSHNFYHTFVVCVAAMLFGFIFSMMRPRMRIVRYRDKQFWILGSGKAFRDSLPEG